ncbi:unnamed protein product [Auanema sp. JU1783]|nr:unnamed protein product [Auanema sp. JU1783]
MVEEYTIDETIPLGNEVNTQVVAFLGDYDRTVCALISVQLPGSQLDFLKLDNRYYNTKVGIRHFRCVQELDEWLAKQKNGVEVGVLIVRYNNKQDLNFLADNTQLCQEAQAIVLDDESSDADGFALQWATDNNFEIVYLNPDLGNREEAASHNEKIGPARLAEIIQTVNWPTKHHKMKNITGKEKVDRILQLLDKMDFSSESENEPDEEDKDAIWTAFTTAVSNSPTPEEEEEQEEHEDEEEEEEEMNKEERVKTPAERNSPVTISEAVVECVEATISVDVVLNNTKKADAITSDRNQVMEETKKKKNKKNKKAKNDGPSVEPEKSSPKSEEKKSKEEEASSSEHDEDAVDKNQVIATLFKDLNMKPEDIEVLNRMINSVENGSADTTVGDLSKIREEIAGMNTSEARIDRAETVIRGIARSLNVDFGDE